MSPVKVKQESFKIEFGIFAGIDYFSRKIKRGLAGNTSPSNSGHRIHMTYNQVRHGDPEGPFLDKLHDSSQIIPILIACIGHIPIPNCPKTPPFP